MRKTKSKTSRLPPAVLRKMVGAAVVLALIGWFFWGETTIRISEAQVQKSLDSVFPVVKKDSLYMVSVSNPEVILPPGQDRVKLRVDLEARLLGSKPIQGNVQAIAGMRFEPQTGSIYLVNPEVSDLTIKGAPDTVTRTLGAALAPLLKAAADKQPVYRVESADPTRWLLRRTLKSVQIVDGAVQLRFGL